jgi:hypothetical protein
LLGAALLALVTAVPACGTMTGMVTMRKATPKRRPLTAPRLHTMSTASALNPFGFVQRPFNSDRSRASAAAERRQFHPGALGVAAPGNGSPGGSGPDWATAGTVMR